MIVLIISAIIACALVAIGIYRLVKHGREDRSKTWVYALDIASIVVGAITILVVVIWKRWEMWELSRPQSDQSKAERIIALKQAKSSQKM